MPVVRTVEFVDASLERTRLTFQVEVDESWRDTVTLRGFVPIVPGTRVMLTLSYGDAEGM